MHDVERVHSINWHRNGISGAGFYVVHFTGRVDLDTLREFVAVVHPSANDDGYETTKSTGFCSVLSLADEDDPENELAPGAPEVANCWRGDHFEPELRAAIVERGTSRQREARSRHS